MSIRRISHGLIATTLTLIATVAFTSNSAWAGVSMSEAPAVRAEAVSGAPPAMSALTDMSLKTEETADQALHATDADGDPLTFSKSAGPAFMTVTTTDPGTGTATGNVHLAPGASDAGSFTVIVQVTDGALFANRSFRVIVADAAEVAPVLTALADMTVRAGQMKEQTLYASDENGDALAFIKVSGPAYMTVFTMDENVATGTVRLSPTAANVGNATGVVQVSDGTLSDQKSFFITVLANNVPFLNPPSSMTVAVGDTATQALYAYDNDGDPLTFSKVSGPYFMVVSTVNPGTGSATGLLYLQPQNNDYGSYAGTIGVTDGLASDQKSIFINVTIPNHPPLLGQPADMNVTVGETAEQTVSASDPDGD